MLLRGELRIGDLELHGSFGMVAPEANPPPIYDGDYTVTPLVDAETTLETKGKLLQENVKVLEIPIAEVSNTSGGITITIGG